MALRPYQLCEIVGIAFILLSTSAQIFWVQPYERDIESRERYAIESMSTEDRRRLFSSLNRSIVINQVVLLRELNQDVYEKRKEKLSPIINGNFIDLSEMNKQKAYLSGNITQEIIQSDTWKSIESNNPFTKANRYWLIIQKRQLRYATYVAFGFFLLGSLLTAVGRGFEMRHANMRHT